MIDGHFRAGAGIVPMFKSRKRPFQKIFKFLELATREGVTRTKKTWTPTK